MEIVFFTHPNFLGSQSMPRYALMLGEGMKERGAGIDYWTATARFVKLPLPSALKKWLGYIDQYIVFPIEVKKRLRHTSKNTLFVFTDHALGPWVPLVADRKHVIHCHDFLAQRSALGEIIENPTSWSGRLYQAYIRWGYRKGKNFISVSEKTREDLSRFLLTKPCVSEVVYNAINPRYVPMDKFIARSALSDFTQLDLTKGYFLHVGGNQWYKNRIGVIALYNAWRRGSDVSLPLLLVGQSPSVSLMDEYHKSVFKDDIHFLENVPDEYVHIAYAGATVFLFPSLAEGFGWPIAEAMASACPVVTTGEAPMTEVAGGTAVLVNRMPSVHIEEWASIESRKIQILLEQSDIERQEQENASIKNVQRFNSETILNKIYAIYNLL